MNKKKKNFKVPNVLIILFGLILICSILSYIIPAGAYDMMELDGRSVVDPDSYHQLDQTPVSLMQMLTSLTRGLQDVSSIVFFLFIVAGSLAVVQATGALEAGLGRMARKMSGRGWLLIPIILGLFGLGGATFGMCEEAAPFVPLFVALCIAMGFDSIVGTAIVMVGAASLGWAGEFMNPFCLQVAQGIAELPVLSGMGLRIALFVSLWVVTSVWIVRYANKVKKDPKSSLVYDIDIHREDSLDLDHLPEFDARKKLVLVAFILMICLLIFGVIKYGWYMDEISALFLGGGIVCAIIGKMGFNRYAEVFGKGMSDITMGALIVGISKAIVIVLNDGNIMHVFLHGAAVILGVFPPTIAAVGMYIFQNILNLIVVSGSGQAALTMPLMAPLADLVGVTRQTAVMALSIGNGLSNVLTPVSGFLMAALALGKIPWEKWAKWMLPLFGLQFLVGLIFIVIAQVTGYGPF